MLFKCVFESSAVATLRIPLCKYTESNNRGPDRCSVGFVFAEHSSTDQNARESVQP